MTAYFGRFYKFIRENLCYPPDRTGRSASSAFYQGVCVNPFPGLIRMPKTGKKAAPGGFRYLAGFAQEAPLIKTACGNVRISGI